MAAVHGGVQLNIGAPFAEVLAAAKVGAPWAFTRLWESLRRPVAGYLRSQGAEEPEDLVSEVFLGAFRRIGEFEGDESQFRSWVFTIAHHRLIDQRRRRARRPERADRPPPERAGGDVESEALAVIGARRVEDVLERLAPDQRDVLLLRIVADLTVEEVATALGKTPGAVKALQRRGLAALRREIGGEGVPL